MRMLPIDKGMVGAFNDKIEFHPASFTDNRDRSSPRSRIWTSGIRHASTTPSIRASTG